MSKFLKLIKNSKGATAIAAMQNIGTKLGTTFNNVSNKL